MPAEDPALVKLRSCVARLDSGPWRFVQLRGLQLGGGSIDGDDVDLLGSRASVESLVSAVFEWVVAGECHARVVSRSSAKTGLILISTDGQHRLELDLWTELWQLHDRSRCLRHEDCEALVAENTGSIGRLPVITEAAVYVHHLVSKRKDLAGSSVRERLEAYAAACRDDGRVDLAVVLDTIRVQGKIGDEELKAFDAVISGAFPRVMEGGSSRRWSGIPARFLSVWLGAPRRLSLVSVMGCDGAGKTTLCRELVGQGPPVAEMMTGKHLYRKSWLYKLSVIFIRPLLFQSREKYDETIAPLVYLRACVGLRLKRWSARRGILLIDRNLADFLMIDRKTDRPRFSRFKGLFSVAGMRIPVIHCVLPFSLLSTRKDEMTEAGHDAYDRAMFRELSGRIPTDYTLFNNAGGLEESTAAAGELLRWMESSR